MATLSRGSIAQLCGEKALSRAGIAGVVSSFSVRSDAKRRSVRLEAVCVCDQILRPLSPSGPLRRQVQELNVTADLAQPSGRPLAATCTCVIGERGR